MISFEAILQKQLVQMAGLMGFGLLMLWPERKFAVRDVKAYRGYKLEALALAILFIESALFGASIEFGRRLPIFEPAQKAINSMPWWALIPLASLGSDLINYSFHRLLHSEHFWRFHRFHHSPEQLFWFTGFRGSLVHNLLLAFKNISILILANLNPIVLMTLAIQGLYAQMAGHVNFDLRLPLWPRLFVTPQYHRIHHAVDRKLHDSNYGFVYVFWDKMFGTQSNPDITRKDFDIGLPESEKVSLTKMIIG